MSAKSPAMRVLTTALSLCLLAAGTAAQTVNLSIYHTSDLHEQTGNLARIAAYVKHQKAADPNVLLIDTGDWFNRGDPAVMFTRGEGMLALLGATGYDAVVFGNHDGSFTASRLAELIDRFKLPLVSANGVWPKDTAPQKAVPYKLFKLKGITVGVIGVTTPGINHNPLVDLRATDPIKAMAKYVPEVRKQADIVIAITHIGMGWDAALAKTVPGIDAILGGHDHRHFRKVIPAAGGRKIPLQHDYAYGRALGQLVIKYDTKAKRIVKYYQFVKRIEPGMPEDKDVKALRDTYLAPWSDVVAKAPAQMDYHAFYGWLAGGVREAAKADAALMFVPVPQKPKPPRKADAAALAALEKWTPPPAIAPGDVTRGTLMRPIVRWSLVTFTVKDLAALKALAADIQVDHKAPMIISAPKDATTDKPLKVVFPCVMYEAQLNLKTAGLKSDAVSDIQRETHRSLWQIADEYARKTKTVAATADTIIPVERRAKEPAETE